MKRTAAVFLVLILLVITLTGCQKGAVSDEAERLTKLDDYLASAKEQSNTLKSSLENDLLTQINMNQKAQELDELWEATLNHVLDEAKSILPEDEWAKLADEQNTWMQEKEKAVQAAAKEFEGGSLYALTMSLESARITEERVNALYRVLMQHHRPS